jgi:hypothetical protein
MVASEAPSQPAALSRLSPSDQDAVREAMRSFKVDVPASLHDLKGPSDPLRNTSDRRVRLLDPVGTLVSGLRPEFAWEPVQDADYAVVVFDSTGREIQRSGWIPTARWRAARDLQRNAVYSWQLLVRRRGAAEPASKPVEARFRVASEQEASELAKLREQAGDDPVIRAILMTRAGFLAEAQTLLEEAGAGSAAADASRRLLADLQAARAGARK